MRTRVLAFAVMAASTGSVALAAESQVGVAGALDKQTAEKAFPARRPYSPYVGANIPTRPYFGDTHLHTSFSMDAGAFGARLTPRDAYVFARGNEVQSSSGQPVRLSRPLDFLVVADHSDGMGFFPMIMAGTPEIMADPQGKKWHDMIVGGQGGAAAIDIIQNFGKGTISKAILPVPGTRAYQSAWDETIKAAEEANEPGRFTAFIGFEWTSNTAGNNLHRNVIFRDGATKAGMTVPYTTMQPLGSDNPVELWKWMAAFEDKTGGNVLAIAHNGNLSNGRMFPTVEAFGLPIDRGYSASRAKWERLYEATQTKGDGETHPVLALICGLLVAGGVHVAKATARPVITGTTAGVLNPVVSAAEDAVSLVVSVLSIVVPVLGLILLLAVLVWLIRRRWRRRDKPAATW